MTTKTLTSSERQAIYRAEFRSALNSLTPSMPNRYSGQQVAYAKGVARRNALRRIEVS